MHRRRPSADVICGCPFSYTDCIVCNSNLDLSSIELKIDTLVGVRLSKLFVVKYIFNSGHYDEVIVSF